MVSLMSDEYQSECAKEKLYDSTKTAWKDGFMTLRTL